MCIDYAFLSYNITILYFLKVPTLDDDEPVFARIVLTSDKSPEGKLVTSVTLAGNVKDVTIKGVPSETGEEIEIVSTGS